MVLFLGEDMACFRRLEWRYWLLFIFGWCGGRCIVRVITCAWLVCLDGIPVLWYFFDAVIGGRVESTVFLRPLVIHHDHRIYYKYDKGWNNRQLATSMQVLLLVFHARCKAVQQFFAYAPPLLLCTALRLVKGRNIRGKEGQEKRRRKIMIRRRNIWRWPDEDEDDDDDNDNDEHGKEWLWDIRIMIVKPAPWKSTQLHWIILRRNVLDQQIQERPTSYKVFRCGELFWFVFWSDSAAASWDHRFLPHSSIGSLCNHAVSRAAADEVGNASDVWEMAHSLPFHYDVRGAWIDLRRNAFALGWERLRAIVVGCNLQKLLGWSCAWIKLVTNWRRQRRRANLSVPKF